MAEYNIVITSPEVTELIVVKVSKEFYEYWKDKELDEKIAACEDSDGELDIPDEFRLDNWHSMNDRINGLVHLNGPDPTEANIEVTDEDFETVYSGWCGECELLDNPDQPDFFAKNLTGDWYIMKLHRESDGQYFTGTLDVDDFSAGRIQLVCQAVENLAYDSEPGQAINYIQGVAYLDGNNRIQIDNTDETYQDINGFTRIDLMSSEDYRFWLKEFEE